MSEVSTRAAGEDKDALADPVGKLAFLERAVLHRRQQVLQPGEVPGVELVPEYKWRSSGKHGIPHLVVGADQVVGPFELRQVELEHGVLFAEHALRNLFQAEGFAGAGRAEDRERQWLLLWSAIPVAQHQLTQ